MVIGWLYRHRRFGVPADREGTSRCRRVLRPHRGEPVQGQNLVYAFYTDEKTSYPLSFRQYEKADDEDKEDQEETKYELAREIITEPEGEVGVPAGTRLFDSWFTHDSSLIEHVESYGKDRVGRVRSNWKVTYANKERRVDALEERTDKEE